MSNDNLEKLSEEELLIRLGTELSKSERFVLPPSKDRLRKTARHWLNANFEALQKHICTEERIKKMSQDLDTSVLAVAISDLISAVCIGVSPVTVAYLLIRKGLKEFCIDYWEQGNN